MSVLASQPSSAIRGAIISESHEGDPRILFVDSSILSICAMTANAPAESIDGASGSGALVRLPDGSFIEVVILPSPVRGALSASPSLVPVGTEISIEAFHPAPAAPARFIRLRPGEDGLNLLDSCGALPEPPTRPMSRP